MKKTLLSSVICLGAFATPVGAQAGGPASEAAQACASQPLTFACLDHYAQRNQDNVAKVFADVSAGRLPTLRPPAVPLLESLPTIDLEKMVTTK
jgi:hypothetical protein